MVKKWGSGRTLRGAGRAAGAALAVLGLVAAAVAFLPLGAGLVVVLNGLALGGGFLAWSQAKAARQAAEKFSGELDGLSGRLIGVEARVAEVSRRDDSGIRASVAEVTGEIGLLGSLMRDLTVTVAAQDREVTELKDTLNRITAAMAERSPPASKPMGTSAAASAAAAAAPAIAPMTQRAAPERTAPRPTLVQPVAAPERAVSPLRPPAPPAEPVQAPRSEPVKAPRSEPVIPEADARRMAAILQAFEAERLELHLQPIVGLPQRRVRFYEVLARLRLMDETILVPAEFMPLLERLGHMPEFDRKVLIRAMTVARHLVARGSDAIVSCNLSPRSLEEPGFLRSVGRLVEAYPDTAGKVVLELSQRCWRTLDAEKAGALASLRERGIPFALDRATDLRLDPLALADRGVRFVKLPADLMLAPEAARGLDIEMADLAVVLQRAGIRLIAERVEREEIVPDLLDLDVPLAQGFLFAPPRAVRAEVLTPASIDPAPAAGVSAPAPAASATSEPEVERRLPYRSFLRRAG